MYGEKIHFRIISSVLGILLSIYYTFFKPNILINQPTQRIVISKQSSFEEITEQMQKHHILQNVFTFRLASWCLRYPKQIKPGSYELSTTSNNYKTIQKLKKGLQKPVEIIIGNFIQNKEELAEQITKNIQLNKDTLLAIMNNKEIAETYGFTTENILGMFIPNTYQVYWNISAKELLNKIHKAYQKFWNEERKEKAKLMGLDLIEVIILASIVYGEAAKVEEYSRIAGVFMNRLKSKRHLQSCVTLQYLLKKERKPYRKIYFKHLKIDSPYNTYKYKGLPPGPINLPSINVIDKVLHYEKHAYLYFAIREDLSGYHNFSQRFDEHMKYFNKYQIALQKFKREQKEYKK